MNSGCMCDIFHRPASQAPWFENEDVLLLLFTMFEPCTLILHCFLHIVCDVVDFVLFFTIVSSPRWFFVAICNESATLCKSSCFLQHLGCTDLLSSCFTSNELRFQIAAQSFSNTRAFFVNTSLFQKRFTEDQPAGQLAGHGGSLGRHFCGDLLVGGQILHNRRSRSEYIWAMPSITSIKRLLPPSLHCWQGAAFVVVASPDTCVLDHARSWNLVWIRLVWDCRFPWFRSLPGFWNRLALRFDCVLNAFRLRFESPSCWIV